MRIVILCEQFAPEMGYLNNTLPKYLARAGAEVHVVTLGLPPYFRASESAALVSAQVLPAGTSQALDGFQLHVLACGLVGRHAYAKGLGACLKELKPDIVYSLTAIGPLPLQAASFSAQLGYKLYTGNHTSAEAFPLAKRAHPSLDRAHVQAFTTRFIPGRLVSLATQLCYCRTEGCGDIASRYFGVQPSKIRVVPLGVDTDYFFPVSSHALREHSTALRAELGFEAEDIVCINTGRMIANKDLGLLSAAIRALRSEGLRFRGLFIGEGPERAQLAAADGCVVLPLKPFKALGDYYRAADLAVWPAGESTSMFDAAACGIPLIVSDDIDAHLDGNGLTFRTHDGAALLAALRRLADRATRTRLGAAGAQLVRERQAMERIASTRMQDFRRALGQV
jgi:glycosyltransferase involved in cell wall biosynthesis